MSRPPTLTTRKTVGHPTPRIDALERVTGKATYTGDVHLPGMLYARILRSPHAHAQIRKLDVSKALALPGVKLVLTHENRPPHRRDISNNPLRFCGEPVAAVAAINRHIAEEAVPLITVEYEALPF